MSKVSSNAVLAVTSRLRSETGLKFSTGQIREREGMAIGGLTVAEVVSYNISPEILEKRVGASYPSVHVFCERVENAQAEKFRTFSGTLQMVTEVRVSQDHLDGLEEQLRFQLEAITSVLDLNRGDWGGGLFYGGGYRIDFHPIKHGGRLYLQTARISFSLKASVN